MAVLRAEAMPVARSLDHDRSTHGLAGQVSKTRTAPAAVVRARIPDSLEPKIPARESNTPTANP